MLRVAAFVSGGGTNLQAIIDAQNSGIITDAKVQLVISNVAGAYALERAEKAGIKTATIRKKDFENAAQWEDALVKELKKNSIDLIVLAGFLSILSEDFIKQYPNRIINVHPSLIPSFCGDGMYGLKVHEAALAKGVKVTGNHCTESGGSSPRRHTGSAAETCYGKGRMDYSAKGNTDNCRRYCAGQHYCKHTLHQ